MRQPYAPFSPYFSSPFVHSFIYHHRHPKVAVTIQTRTSRHGSLHVYKPALLLLEEGIVLESSHFLSPSLSILLTRVLPRPSNRLSGTAVRTILAGTLSQRSLFPPLSLSFLSHSLLLGRHFHPRSTYLRCTTNNIFYLPLQTMSRHSYTRSYTVI